MLPITEKMSIPEIVTQYPSTSAVFLRHGIRVEGYKAIEFEDLGATARVHQINIDELLNELNHELNNTTKAQ